MLQDILDHVNPIIYYTKAISEGGDGAAAAADFVISSALSRFDTDKDGTFSDEEIEAMKHFLQEMGYFQG